MNAPKKMTARALCEEKKEMNTCQSKKSTVTEVVRHIKSERTYHVCGVLGIFGNFEELVAQPQTEFREINAARRKNMNSS